MSEITISASEYNAIMEQHKITYETNQSLSKTNQNLTDLLLNYEEEHEAYVKLCRIIHENLRLNQQRNLSEEGWFYQLEKLMFKENDVSIRLKYNKTQEEIQAAIEFSNQPPQETTG